LANLANLAGFRAKTQVRAKPPSRKERQDYS
jgi:hypothetical protein